MNRPVTVACVQAEPVVLDLERTLDRLEILAAEAAHNGAGLVVFPETFVPVYPSSRWAKAFAGWENDAAKQTFARIAQNSVAVGSPAERRLGAAAKELGVWLVTGVNEVEPERPGTIYNSLLYHAPDGTLALHHRKLVPTNHERLVWGQGDGRGLTAVETGFGRIGGLICWENYMPLARFALYEAGVEIYIASTADDGDAWQSTLVHIARESRAYVISPCHFQRASSYSRRLPAAQRAGRCRDPRPRRQRDPRARRLVSRRPRVRRGADPLRRARSGARARGAAALRSGRPLQPSGRAAAERQS
jgi:nitrilase